MHNFIETLKKELPALRLLENVSWRKVSTIGIGADIPLLAEPSGDIELISLLKLCSKRAIPVKVIGAGSNLVGPDTPFEGIIIRLLHNFFSKIVYGRHNHITVGAGIKLSELLRELAGKGFGGAAPLAAIPGTLGGALRMNAGAHGVEIKDFVCEICGLTLDGLPWTADTEDLNWCYRSVDIPDDIIITGAICQFPGCEPEDEYQLINDEFNWRNQYFPAGRSTGCVFRNPDSAISAGKLIDDAGCKGMSSGGAVVSDKHANYLLNADHATEQEYIDLIIKVKQAVLEATGINLGTEVKFLLQESSAKIASLPELPEVIVLKGGNSNEREVSIQSGTAVAKALVSAGYKVREVTVTDFQEVEDLIKEIRKSSGKVVFPVLHGGYGEDGRVQKLFEDNNIPYVGNSSHSCELAMDKEKSKKIMEREGLPTPKYAIIANPAVRSELLHSDTAKLRAQAVPPFPENLSLPVIVKPPEEGSTVGITLVRHEVEWENALKKSFKYSAKALVEEFVKGKEITVGIIDGKVLPVVEIQFPGPLFDYDAKYEHKHGETLYLCPPATISEDIQKKAQETALAFAEAIEVRDLTRIDFIVDENDDIYILEANNMPGFTASSLLPKSAAVAGISFPQLCGTLVQSACAYSKV
jgi:UDP-N-acetylenolpyruvoylglucosamine reductase